MKINELPSFLEDELDYPIDHAAVVERIGAVEIDAPDDQGTETISVIIDGVGLETYRSADELFETIIGNVSDEYIGRKFYDDRGSNPVDTETGLGDEADVSF